MSTRPAKRSGSSSKTAGRSTGKTTKTAKKAAKSTAKSARTAAGKAAKSARQAVAKSTSATKPAKSVKAAKTTAKTAVKSVKSAKSAANGAALNGAASKAAPNKAAPSKAAPVTALSPEFAAAAAMIRTASPPMQPASAAPVVPVRNHKYRVGETVYYTSPSFGRAAASGSYTVVRLLPSDGEEQQYRIKSSGEAFERVAKESQLDRA